MTFVSGNIPNLINGVSQQPDTLRNPTQAVEQINGLSTAATGLRKRPELVNVESIPLPRLPNGMVNLSDMANKALACHFINRDGVERYAVTVQATATQASVLVTDLVSGVTTAASGAGAQYLFTDDASRDIRFLTIADSTFILNRSKVVGMGPAIAAPFIRRAAYAYVQAGNYGKAYSLTIRHNGATNVLSYTTANGGSAADSLDISTDNIAQNLQNQFNAAKLTTPAWATLAIKRLGSTLIFFTTNTGASNAISIVGEDGFGGNAMKVFAEEISDFSLLPPTGDPTMPPIRVAGDINNDFRGYFVRFKGTEGGEGVYEEVPDIYNNRDVNFTDFAVNSFDDNTMPHQLVITPSSKTFGPVTWGDRLAGDSISSPAPSFVGKKINGLFFTRGRLGFLSQDAVVMSAAEDFFRFFPRRVAAVLDNDPIDVKANSTFVDDFYHAVPFDEKLVLFGGRSQFTLKGSPLLTPKTVEINQVSAFEVSRECNPVASGRRIFFSYNRQGFTGVNEFFVNDNDTVESQELTGQVPEYIPRDSLVAASAANESLVAYLTKDRKDLFVYRFYLSGTEKLMSSWSRWELPTVAEEANAFIAGIGFIESRLYVTTVSGSGLQIGYLELSQATPLGEDFRVNLDNKVRVSTGITYNSGADTSRIIVPHPFPRNALVVFQGAEDRDGEIAEGTWSYNALTGEDSLVVPGDATGYTLIIGEPFEFYYEFSTIYVRSQSQGGGSVADTRARLQLRNLQVVFEDSYNFTAEVTPERRTKRLFNMNGARLNSNQSILGEPALVSGTYRFPIGTKNTDTQIGIRDNSVYPLQLLSATWEGMYNKRSRGV